MQIHKDIIQGTPEWHAIRKGKMTASHAQEIGNNGKGLETYIFQILAAEYSSGEVEFYSNKNMERGTELEDAARSMYELETGATVDQVGFILHNDFVGCSPDGLIGNDGGIEIKCHDDVSHFKMLVNGSKEIDSKYLWQIQMNLLITGRQWWDYVAYNPNFKQSLIITRVLPDREKHNALLNGFVAGEIRMKSIKSKLS